MLLFCSSTSSSLHAGDDALVVVVNGHGQHLLGAVLADDVLVKQLGDASWLGYLASQVELSLGGAFYLFVHVSPGKARCTRRRYRRPPAPL